MSEQSDTKTFMFLTYGFKKPSPEEMAEWGKWFESIADRMLQQGGFWSGGKELSSGGVKDLPFGEDSITGFVTFTAESLDDAVAIASECPVVASNRVYEIMSK